ncbi:MAG: septum site-determining protein MinC [Lachnospiraceae bacterium]|nr:septum site-determining protein MinC [Lachnospiraceae bacterium]
MNNSVVIKGNKYGIVVVMDDSVPFDELKVNLLEKFKSAAKFFDKANMAVSFEGRKLSPKEERECLDIISENSDLNIVCVIDNDELREKYFKKAVEDKLEELSSHTGQFYKGTLRSGQMLESDSSLIVLGDVNPGAKVIAKGNVIILGALKGNIYAGAGGNEDSFVVALEMAPIQIRIGDTIARSNDSARKNKALSKDAMIAFVEDGNIYIEKLDKDTLGDIRL